MSTITKPAWPDDIKKLDARRFRLIVEKLYDWWNLHDQGVLPISALATKLSTYTSNVTLSTENVVLVDTTSAAITITLPDSTGKSGFEYRIMNIGTKMVTIVTTSSQTINGGLTFFLPTKYYSVGLISDGSNWLALL